MNRIVLLILLSSLTCAAYSMEDPAIVAARRDLVLSEATLRRIEGEIRKHQARPKPIEEVLADYSVYLTKVRTITELYRARLERLQEAQVALDRAKGPEKVAPLDVIISEPDTKLDQLSKEFIESLAAFDDFVMDEAAIAQEQLLSGEESGKLQGLAAEAAAAVDRLKEKGIDLNPESESTQPQTAGTETAQTDPATMPKGGTTGADKQPSHRNPEDDDIVARQLREAAEKETDPKLKKKLWEEYDSYKNATVPKRKDSGQ